MEFFIEQVKLYPFLWDMNDMSYRDISKKEMTWKRIAKDCEMTNGKEAKALWKKLRDSHREAMRRRKSCTELTRPWKYEILMDFLLPQAEMRAAASNNDSLNTADTNNDTDVGSPSSPPESTVLNRRSAATMRKKQRKFISFNVSDPLQQKEKIREQREAVRDDFRRRLFDTNRGPQDALSSLFDSFCQKTRELPRYLQLRVQRECFESISRAEEEAMSIETKHIYCSPLSSTSSYRYCATNSQENVLPSDDPVGQTSPTYPSSPDYDTKT